MSGLLEDNWILLSDSASNLLGYVVLVKVQVYKKNILIWLRTDR